MTTTETAPKSLPKTKWGGPWQRRILAKRIRRFLRLTGATPTEFAAAVKCSERQVRYWLCGVYYPYPDQAKRIEAVLVAGKLPWSESSDVPAPERKPKRRPRAAVKRARSDRRKRVTKRS